MKLLEILGVIFEIVVSYLKKKKKKKKKFGLGP